MESSYLKIKQRYSKQAKNRENSKKESINTKEGRKREKKNPEEQTMHIKNNYQDDRLKPKPNEIYT